MREIFHQAAIHLALFSEAVATLVIAYAIVSSLLFAIRRNRQPQDDRETDLSIWIRLRLGRGLTVALEFLLAADIVRTAIAPDWNTLGRLAAIAALRTGLNFFLEKEIREEAAELAKQFNTHPQGDPQCSKHEAQNKLAG